MPPQNSATLSSGFSFERASVWALIGTLILSLIIIIPVAAVPFLPTKVFLLAAGTIVTLAFYILARLTRGNVIVPPVALLGALWLPAIAYALSTLFSGSGIAASVFGSALEPDTFGFVATAAFLGTLAALLFRRSEHYQLFFKSLAYALGFVAVVQVLILLVAQVAPASVSPSLSIVGSFEDLSIVLGLGIVGALLAFRFLVMSKRSRTLLMVGGVLALALLAVLNSGLVWALVALVSFGLFVEAVMQRSPGNSESDLESSMVIAEHDSHQGTGSRPLAAPLVVLAVSLFFLLGSTLGNALASLTHVNVLSVRPSWQSTLSVGKGVYAHSAFFGSGPGTFGKEWLMYRDASLNQSVFWNVDFTSGIGFVPTSFVTTGILGVIMWIAFFALFIFFGIRAIIFRAPEDHAVRFISILSFVGASYLFVVSIFALPGNVLIALAFVLAGIFASTLRFARGGAQWGIAFARSPRIGFVIVFSLTLLLLASIAAAYSLIERYVAQVDLSRAIAAANAGDIVGASNALNGSLAFVPSATAYAAQAQIAQAELQQIAASTTLPAATAQQQFQASLSAGINAALTATRLSPDDYQNWLALGNLYAAVVPLSVQGAYDNAKTAYEKAATLNPTNPTIPYLLAQLAIANKDTVAAQTYLKQAISLKQDYTAAIFLLSQLEVADGNLKDALASAEAAAYFTPNDQNVLFQLGLLRAASGNTDGALQALAAAVAVNPQFANARYFLGAVYAKKGDLTDALAQLQAIAALSADNAKAVNAAVTSLQAGKNPFPANLLSASSTPISQ